MNRGKRVSSPDPAMNSGDGSDIVDAGDLLPSGLRPEVGRGLENEQRRREVEAALFGGAATDALMLGRYRLMERLGAGGMGTIFAGLDAITGDSVAIKVMHQIDHDARRFKREISVLATLRHARIVRYLDHGTTGDGRPYLVMERLTGEDLQTHLGRRRPSVRECIVLGIHIAEGLQFAHERGFIHRDIKPSNIFLVDTALDGAKILDFGLVRASEGKSTITHTGAILGTFGYMAPEQADGSPRLDHRIDLFSLGCVLYEALAGRPPFSREDAVARLVTTGLDKPRPLKSVRPEIPARLQEVVQQVLAKRPEDRLPSATSMIAALNACAAEIPPEPGSVEPLPQT